MDEKERQAIEEETTLLPAEEPADEAEEDMQEDGEEQRLYLGRFTPGVWHGGILGIAMSYIIMGLLGMLNKHFSLGMDSVIQSPFLKYGLLLVLCYGLGKLGGVWERNHKDD